MKILPAALAEREGMSHECPPYSRKDRYPKVYKRILQNAQFPSPA